MRWLLSVTLAAVSLGLFAPAAPAQATRPAVAKHVVLLGLDGARADLIRDHGGPHLRSLVASGTVCWNAQAVTPSVTQVNWASILTGATPAHHGIDKHPVEAQELAGRRTAVPTLFDLLSREGLPSAGFLGHWKLYPNETDQPHTHVIRSPYESTRVLPIALDYLTRQKPAFCFIYLGDLDGLGHRNGWMSPPYIAGVETIDRGIGAVLKALDDAGMRNDTILLITSDHGGTGKAHGAGTPEDRTIPWILAGRGVKKGLTITRAVSTVDTAPTVLRALGIAPAGTMDGQPVEEAFEP